MASERLDGASITLSVVVTAHAEGQLLRPTLRSVATAIAEAAKSGFQCELVVVLDNATDLTRAEARQWEAKGAEGSPVRVLEVSNGDVGASRNAGVENARGAFAAFCDGDDLVSRNYFSAGVEALMGTAAEERVIVHPEVVMSFGDRALVWNVPSSREVDHTDLIRDNLWPASSISRRDTYLSVPYRSMPPATGLGPEDHFWNIETSLAGIEHHVLPNTMFFYRVRAGKGLSSSHVGSLLPPFDVAKLKAAMPSRKPLDWRAFEARHRQLPQNRLARVIVNDLSAMARLLRRIARLLLHRISRVAGVLRRYFGAIVKWTRSATSGESVPSGDAGEEGRWTTRHLRDATAVEPAISWAAVEFDSLPRWQREDDAYPHVLLDALENFNVNTCAIVAVPWVGIGGADLVSINYARALAASTRLRGEVAFLATFEPMKTVRELVPDNVRFVQLHPLFRTLTEEQRRRLIAQVLLIANPDVVVSVNCFDLVHSLQSHWRALTSSMRIYATLFAFDRIGAGFPTNPITDDSQREYLTEIDGIITDNSVTAGAVSNLLAIEASKLLVHYQPSFTETPKFQSETRAYNDRLFSHDYPFRILWPHRLDREKRPDALVDIAQQLKQDNLPAVIEVYGQQVLSTGGESLLRDLKGAGVVYRGPYSGGLSSLPTEDYHALLLTSEWEGLPNAIVQSMLLGLPVVSTAVGGVGDLVRHGETGFLVSGPEDSAGFVAAIRRLMASTDDRRLMIRRAYDLACSQHDWAQFCQAVDDLVVGDV